ncbi:hypothetical protein ES702_00663 [subsurface metagenome]
MATIQDWQYVLPHRKFERVLFIGENAELYEPLLSTLSRNGDKKLSIHSLRGGAKLPHKAVDLIITDSADVLNFLFKFNELLKSGGLLFARIKGKVFKKTQNILDSRDWTWTSAYAAFPSFENLWYIVSLDNRHVLAYALKNVFSSRTLLRRFILRGAGVLASLGLTELFITWLPCVVVIVEKR